MNNLELRVSQASQELGAAIAQLKVDMLLAIDAKLPQPIPPLDSFNRILEPEIAHMVQRKMEFLGIKKRRRLWVNCKPINRHKTLKVLKRFWQHSAKALYHKLNF